jgi:hypothetical protein
VAVSEAVHEQIGPSFVGDPVYNGFNQDLKPSIKFAFSCKHPVSGEVRNFFMLQHEMNIPIMRSYQAKEIYAQLEYGLSPLVVTAMCNGVIALCDPEPKPGKQKKTDFETRAEIRELAILTKERVENTNSISLAIDLSTIRYFDEKEDITIKKKRSFGQSATTFPVFFCCFRYRFS